MLEINIKAEKDNFQMPIKGSEQAACYDVYASKIESLLDGLVICYLGFSTEIPEGWKGVVIPRSNITKYNFTIPNGEGVIDSDYRNEWQLRFRKLNHKAIFPYKVGDRVGQIYFEKVNDVKLTLVDETNETKRGKGGFGSTGLK